MLIEAALETQECKSLVADDDRFHQDHSFYVSIGKSAENEASSHETEHSIPDPL